jgi:hypothetical protein
MGSATSLVEAQRLGRRSVGIDINPISCLIARAKTIPISYLDIRRFVKKVNLILAERWHDMKQADVPLLVQAEKWYMPSTLSGLRKIWALIGEMEAPTDAIGLAAFSSILLASCRETRHWGYVCDNTTPQSIRENDPRALFLSSLERFAIAYQERDSEINSNWPLSEIIQNDAKVALTQFPENHFSCVVTSPPYFGVADYVKAQRLSMEWLSIEIEPIRLSEVGARSKRHRQDARMAYIKELHSIFSQTYRVLKPDAPAIVIFGQSPTRVDTYEEFVLELKSIGFSIDLAKKRQIPVTRRQMPSLANEIVLVLRK